VYTDWDLLWVFVRVQRFMHDTIDLLWRSMGYGVDDGGGKGWDGWDRATTAVGDFRR
jgi:hypothetical protein